MTARYVHHSTPPRAIAEADWPALRALYEMEGISSRWDADTDILSLDADTDAATLLERRSRTSVSRTLSLQSKEIRFQTRDAM